jgi:hypothetical protein
MSRPSSGTATTETSNSAVPVSTFTSATSSLLLGTPLRSNSDARRLFPQHSSVAQGANAGSLQSKTKRSSMDHLRQLKLAGNISYDVAGFIDTFFPLSNEIKKLYEYAVSIALYDTGGSRWTSWPASPTEKNVLIFFQDVVDNGLLKQLAIDADCTVYRYVPSGKAIIRNGDCERKTDDLLLTTYIPFVPNRPRDPSVITFSQLADNRYDWKSIRVVGELKSNPKRSDDASTHIQLAHYARELFGSQPARRWVHSFTLCGHQLRAWLFDRSGAICSTIVDINADPQLFLRVICGYSTMDATAIGFDPSIKWAPGGVESVYDPSLAHALAVPPPAYIYAPIYEKNPFPVKLELLSIPIFKRTAIISRGSVCWKARLLTDTESQASSQESIDAPYQYVVKDQWRSVERQSECEIISAMRPNVVSNQSAEIPMDHFGLPCYAWYGDHRENGQAVDILTTVRKDLMAPCRSAPGSREIERPPPPPPPPPVAVHWISQAAAEDQPSISNSDPPSTPTRRSRKHSCNDPAGPSTKRLKLEDSPQQPESQASQPSVVLINRVFSRVVMSPIGRAISKFHSYTELLSAMRDAIKGIPIPPLLLSARPDIH